MSDGAELGGTPGVNKGASTTGRFIQQQGGYFRNETAHIGEHYQEFIIANNEFFEPVEFSATTQSVNRWKFIQPVREIFEQLPEASAFFTFFNQAKFLGVEVIINKIVRFTAPAGSLTRDVMVTVQPYNMPATQTKGNPGYTDPRYLPDAIVKLMQFPTITGATATGTREREMMRFSQDNPLFLVEEASEATVAGVPTNQFFYTVGGGEEVQNPTYFGWWINFSTADEAWANTNKFAVSAIVKYKFMFRGLRASVNQASAPTSNIVTEYNFPITRSDLLK